jgi:hypothetical protein
VPSWTYDCSKKCIYLTPKDEEDGCSALILTGPKDLKSVCEEDIQRHIGFRCDLIGIGVRNFDHRFTDQLF